MKKGYWFLIIFIIIFIGALWFLSQKELIGTAIFNSFGIAALGIGAILLLLIYTHK